MSIMKHFIGKQQQGARKVSILVAVSLATIIVGSLCGTSVAAPLMGDDLSLSLTSGSPVAQTGAEAGQHGKLMEQIMSDDYSHDFELSISALNHLASNLEEFVKREQMTDHVANNQPVMKLWAQSKGGSSLNGIMNELDYILSTFWTQFKPLIERVVTHRPDNLGPDDLDFRCKREELTHLKSLSAQSAIYGMYLDTFYSELYHHCLLRKLAMIKNHHVAPPSLVKQFVDIYLELPTSNPMHAASKEIQEQAAHQILAGQAINFNAQDAFARHGSLSSASELVFDPRTALYTGPDSDTLSKNRDSLIGQFQSECQAHSQALARVWGDFDMFSGYFTSETCNLVTLNDKVKRAAPQLVYASICNELLKLPR